MPALWRSLSVCIAILSSALGGAEEPGIEGLWLLESEDVAIRIDEREGGYEGVIVWLKESEYPNGSRYAGETKRDLYNPDPEKRRQPLLGVRILWNFTPVSSEEWEGGTIYDADSGKLYDAVITLENPDQLTARAYVGIQWLGRSITARRWSVKEMEKALEENQAEAGGAVPNERAGAGSSKRDKRRAS